MLVGGGGGGGDGGDDGVVVMKMRVVGAAQVAGVGTKASQSKPFRAWLVLAFCWPKLPATL